MERADVGEITVLLQQARSGDAGSRDELFGLVYGELTRIARARLARSAPLTQIDAPSLVHEAYLRLSGNAELPVEDRRAFFAYAASVMRNVVVDYLRERSAAKRGGDAERVTLVGDRTEFGVEPADFSQLESALQRLAGVDERSHRIVELRYFAGLTNEEIADTLELSLATVKREWRKARAFLYDALHG